MSDPTKAVFLSYASQDAEAAKRICDALRAAGVEVWFDQNELVGGDQWDQKIRGQISSCALFLPLISANTQARLEGYFRLEWKLAAQRTHTMADEKAFLLPILLDGTRDAEAKVPVEFKAVQWTKLPAGETPPAFAARVKKLLSGEQGAAHPERVSAAPALRRSPSKWWWALPIFGVTMALLLVMKEGRKEPAAPAAPTPAVTAPLSEARQLAAQARELLLKPSGGPAKYETAVLLCDRALVLDPTDAEVWAIASQVDTNVVRQSFDPSEKRVASAQGKAAKAINLAPRSFEARLALAAFQSMIGGPPVAAEGESALRALHAENPREIRVLYALLTLLRNQGRGEEALAYAEEAGRLPGGAVTGFTQQAWVLRGLWRFDEADAALDQAIAIEPIAGNVGLKVFLDLGWRGDPDQARATLRKLPADELTMDVGVAAAVRLYRWRREPVELLRFLAAVPRDWLPWSIVGPKAALTGDANAELNRMDAARADWQTALALVEQRLAATPNDRNLLEWKAYLEASLGETALAQATWRRSKEAPAYLPSLLNVEKIQRVAPPDQVIDELEQRVKDVIVNLGQRRSSYGIFISAAELRLNPAWDGIRHLPRFQALQARLDADPRFSPSAKAHPGETLAAIDDKSVAVLAFANLSDDKANEYFSDGISEELLNVLAKVPGLKVTARTSSFSFKGKEVPVPEIAQQLGVAYVVEGSVRKQGDKVRITAQLIKAADGFHVWSDTFTRDLKDIFAVQDDIAGLIAKNLELKLQAATRPEARVDARAFELYMQGRVAWNRRNAEGFDRAEILFRQALAIAPDFARAHAALADVWMIRAISDGKLSRYGQRASAVIPPIEAEAQRALEIDPESAEAHATLGFLRQLQHQPEEALRLLSRSVELNPNYATGHHWLAGMLAYQSRFDESIAEYRRAVAVDPLSPRILDNFGGMLVTLGRWREGLALIDRALALLPDEPQALTHKVIALAKLGRRDAARVLAGKVTERDRMAVLCATGERAEIEAALPAAARADRFELLSNLGRLDEALNDFHSDDIVMEDTQEWFFNPQLVPFQHDPRFRKVVAELGFDDILARALAWQAAHPPEQPETRK